MALRLRVVFTLSNGVRFNHAALATGGRRAGATCKNCLTLITSFCFVGADMSTDKDFRFSLTLINGNGFSLSIALKTMSNDAVLDASTSNKIIGYSINTTFKDGKSARTVTTSVRLKVVRNSIPNATLVIGTATVTISIRHTIFCN